MLAADDVRILATSREPVGVTGEARYRLAPLSLPLAGQGAGGSEALALFVDRARQADPHFTSAGETSDLVARLVAGLDGMPLAIELAAARVESLGVAQLLDRLDDRFGLLVGGDRRAEARQRSLAAAVDWSYQLLSEEERRVFRTLAIFPAPFTLDAAEAVAGAGAGPAVLHLVDCSMLVPPQAGPDGRARYVMLETLRAYAAGRLDSDADSRDARLRADADHPAARRETHANSPARLEADPDSPAARLAGFMLGVAEAAAARLEDGAEEIAAGRQLDAEAPALQQGLAWALDHDPDVALRLAIALAPWWYRRGRLSAGYELLAAAGAAAQTGTRAWCEAQYWLGLLSPGPGQEASLAHVTAVRDALADGAPSLLLARALTARTTCLINLGRLGEGAEDARRSLELAGALGYSAGQVRALTLLGAVAQYAGDHAGALAWLRQAEPLDAGSLPGRVRRSWFHTLTMNLTAVGEAAAAQRACEQGLELARQAADLRDQSVFLLVLSGLEREAGHMTEGRAHLREAIELAARFGSDLMVTDGLDHSALFCAGEQGWADAVTLWAARAACLARIGAPELPREAERRKEPLRRAAQALGPARTRAAEERGAAMTLATAAEYAALLLAAEPERRAGAPGLPRLSARERELVTLVAQGRTDAQIAAQLYISIRTVRSHLDRIRDKSGCRRRADLTRLALETGLV